MKKKNKEVSADKKKRKSKKEKYEVKHGLLGNANDYNVYTVTATAASSDGAEFVRNTDMVYDFITFLSDKLKISEKIEGITQKIRDTCNNIK